MKTTCIICPKGCSLSLQYIDVKPKICGNRCLRGKDFFLQEMKQPLRKFSTTVKVSNGDLEVCPVSSKKQLPKELILDLIRYLNSMNLKAPIKYGDMILEIFEEYEVEIIATRDINIEIGK